MQFGALSGLGFIYSYIVLVYIDSGVYIVEVIKSAQSNVKPRLLLFGIACDTSTKRNGILSHTYGNLNGLHDPPGQIPCPVVARGKSRIVPP